MQNSGAELIADFAAWPGPLGGRLRVTGGRNARDQPRSGRSLAADITRLCDDVLTQTGPTDCKLQNDGYPDDAARIQQRTASVKIPNGAQSAWI